MNTMADGAAQKSLSVQDAHEMADALERIASGSLSDYEGVDADELHILRCAKLIRDLGTRQPVGPKFYTEDGPCWWHNGKAYIVTVDGDNLQLSVMDGVHCEFIGDARPFRVPAQAVDLGAMPDGWRLSKKATCYQLSHGNEIIGNLVGSDAEENAAIIARVLDSKAVGND